MGACLDTGAGLCSQASQHVYPDLKFQEQVLKRTECRMSEETNYLCPNCGEEIVIPIDLTQGDHQEYVEDCPICCSPVIIHLEIDDQRRIHCHASPE